MVNKDLCPHEQGNRYAMSFIVENSAVICVWASDESPWT